MQKINGDIIYIRQLQQKVAEQQQAYKELKGLTIGLVIFMVGLLGFVVWAVLIINSLIK